MVSAWSSHGHARRRGGSHGCCTAHGCRDRGWWGGCRTAEAPVLELYEDFQCPICKTFEEAFGSTLAELISSEAVRVVYYPLSFLDRQLDNDSSLRAANAAGCAQDASAFAAFHDTVFANQPAREGDGYTDEQLLQFGRDAGIEGDAYVAFETCVQDRTYEGWVQQVQQVANDRPVTGTPTLFLDGELVDTGDLITAIRLIRRSCGRWWRRRVIDLNVHSSPSRGEWFLGPIPLRGYAFAIILGVIAAFGSPSGVGCTRGNPVRPVTSRCGQCRSG